LLILVLSMRQFNRSNPPNLLATLNEFATANHTCHVQHSISQPTVQFERCASTVASKTHHFGFNISTENRKQWQFLDSTEAKFRDNFRGGITVEAGDELQSSDIEVFASVRSGSEDQIEKLGFHDSASALDIEYKPGGNGNICTEVVIAVFLRKNLAQDVDLLEIRSQILDIWLKEGVDWKVNNLSTHTSYGETTMMATWPTPSRMIAQNISMSSTHGLLFGRIIPPEENLELRNENGEIGILMFPNPFYPTEPFNTQSISLSTISGPLSLISVFDVPWPEKDYAHRLSISTVSGKIRSQAPHGSYTNYTTVSGDVSCYLRAYGTTKANETSEIYTSSQTGNVSVRVGQAFELGHGRFNSLLNTVSEHSVAEGKLQLSYARDWYGRMYAEIGEGGLSFSGDSLVKFEQGEGNLTAIRGKEGESRINAYVGNGEMDVTLGLEKV